MDIEAHMKEQWEREGEQFRRLGLETMKPAPAFFRQPAFRRIRGFYHHLLDADPEATRYWRWKQTGIYHGWL
jgi:hypothetical protein